MQHKVAILTAFFVVFSSVICQPAAAATSYPFVSTWGQQGLTKTGAFTFPQYAAVDEAGNVYVTDLGNARVQKFDNNGSYLHSWGSKGTRPSEFHAPAGIAVKSNYVYVVDHELSSVKKFDISGNFIKAWGSEGSDPGKLKLPNGIAISKDNSVYVVDTGNSRVQKFDSDGKFLMTIGSSGTDDGQFLTPLGIATDNNGNIYVSDSGNNRIEKFTSDGTFVKKYNAASGGIKISPDGLAIDSSGNMIVADPPNNRIVVIDQDGNTVTTFGKTGTASSQFKMAKDVTIDSNGNLFVVDSSNHRIQKFGTKDATPVAETTQTQQTPATQTQTVTPIAGDIKKPTVITPKDIYVEATGGLTPVTLGKATASDESGIKSLTNNAPSEFPLGITTVIWTAIDGSGNMGIATQTVTVGDSTPPVIGGLSDVVSEAQGTQNTVNLGNPTVTDSVGVLSVTNDAPQTFPLGETKVTWTAVDVAKNVATATQTVTITDTKAPKVKAPAGITMEATSLDHNEVDLGEPAVTDNGEISSITNDAPEFFPLGETTVTWTASDVAGNVATATQKVTIVDTTSPVISHPQDITAEAVSASSTPVQLAMPNATDVQQVTFKNDAPEFFPIGQTKVTWTAVDSSGNNSTDTQIVSIIDTTSPTLTVPENITQEASGQNGNIVSLGQPTTQDISEVTSVTNDAPSDYPLGTTTVTWTAVDKYGNSVSHNQNVTIIDTTQPKISAPADVTAEANSTSENIVSLGEPNVSDLVGVDSVTNDAPPVFPIGQTTVTWTAKDTSGNTATATQSVYVEDTTAPEITLPQDITIEATGPSGTTVSVGSATANDAIGVESLTNDAPNVFNLGLTQITWTAKDTSGNTATAIQNVTVVDTTAPSITAPVDIAAEATSATDNKISLTEPTAQDVVGQVTITNDAPSTFPLGETTVTWTATDESGNSATATQKVTVVDTTSPTISAPSDISVEATSKSDNAVTLETPVATDNVGVTSITNDAPSTFPVGETTVTWTVTDASNLTSIVTQKINVVDTTKPTIQISDIKLEATSEHDNAIDLGNVKATDLVGIASLTNDAPAKFSLGETTVTWTATDESGNSATATQKVTVVDTTSPTISAPSDISVEATSSSDNTVKLGDATATDAVTVSSVTNDAPSTFPLGETTVTWTATDESGNSATATQKVTVVDTTSPTISAPSDISVEATSKSDNTVTLETPVATDNVGVTSITNDAPSTFPVGETTVTWTATDASGNVNTVTQKITITDTVPPKFAKLSDVKVEATSNDNNSVTLATPAVSDILDITSLTNDAPAKFSLGETTVTWTATDESGNSATATQKVTVVDTTSPTISAPSDISVEATSSSDNTVKLGDATATDAVTVSSVTNDAPAAFPLGETTVTWTATDSSGNNSTATQKVTVVDTTSPTISAPENVTSEATSVADNSVTLTPPATSDSVGQVTITNDAPSTFPLGETTVTWTATDESGNSATATQKVTVVDTTAPKLTIPDNIVIDAVSLTTPVSIGTPTATDLTDASPKVTNDAPQEFALGKTIVTWTAIDKFGNTVSQTQTVEVDACGKPESSYNVIIGKEVDDILTGTGLADLIIGLGGDDIIFGEKGNDCILAGDGDDIVYGNEGNDSINGGDGSDVIKGQSGDDILIGGIGTDVIDGGDDNDSCNTTQNGEDDVVIKCES